MNAFCTLKRDRAGRAQYAGTRAWEGCAAWRGETRGGVLRRGEAHPESRPPGDGQGLSPQRNGIANPPRHGNRVAGESVAAVALPQRAVPLPAEPATPHAHRASLKSATDSTPHAQ